MSENLKKLTGKNKNDYEQVAKMMIDTADVELFKELVENDDFLFDFVRCPLMEYSPILNLFLPIAHL